MIKRDYLRPDKSRKYLTCECDICLEVWLGKFKQRWLMSKKICWEIRQLVKEISAEQLIFIIGLRINYAAINFVRASHRYCGVQWPKVEVFSVKTCLDPGLSQ